MKVGKTLYVKNRNEWRRWLAKYGKTATEVWLIYYKKASGKPRIPYNDAVDEALCFGWIDGLKKRVDEDSFMHRFTPRTASSSWSNINVKRARALHKVGRMSPAELNAFRGRNRARSGIYLYEQRPQALSSQYMELFEKQPAAWAFFQAQPPGYRRLVTMWIMMAKRPETRLSRLQIVIDASAASRRSRWM